jgi:transcriptional regulator with XRE-family HTH domain
MEDVNPTSRNETLIYYRREALLSQRELGALVGVTGAQIGCIERGDSAGGWLTRKRLARALDVPERTLFADTPPAPVMAA